MRATVTTRTRTSTIAGIVAILLIAAGPDPARLRLAQPDPGPVLHPDDADAGAAVEPDRGLWRDGVSVGQQAFVGIGAYAMFAGVILWGWDPVPAILLGGVAAFLLAIPMAFFAFRLQGAYFAIGTWVIAEVARLSGRAMEDAGRRHRHIAAA